MLIEKIETKTQEVLLLLTVVGALALVISGGAYLSLPSQEISPLTGNLGLIALGHTFNMLGHSMFYLAIIVIHIGQFLVRHLNTLAEIKSIYKRLSLKLVLEVAMLFLIAASITVVQQFLEEDSTNLYTVQVGGVIGNIIGGNLYREFGLIGASVTLGTALASSLILLGRLQLVHLVYVFIDLFKQAKSFVVSQIIKTFIWIKSAFVSLFNHWVQPHLAARFSFLKRERMASPQRLADELVKESVGTEGSQFSIPPSVPPIVDEVEEEQTAELVAPEFDAQPVPQTKKINSQKVTTNKTSRSQSNQAHRDSDGPTKGETEPTGLNNTVITSYKKRYLKPNTELLGQSTSKSGHTDKELEELCADLSLRLSSFGIEGEVLKAYEGARLLMFEFQPAPGIRLNKITGLSNDLALMLGADSIRILAPIPGRTTVGIEVPRKKPEVVKMGDMMKALTKSAKEMHLPIVVGKNVNNESIIEDIAKMPHMLVSGTTGSGKSVFINNVVVSLLYTRSPKNLRFIMIDPKMIELSPYNGIPHLLRPVVTDLTEAKDQLVWAQDEMDRRYQVFSDLGTRDLQSFNETVKNSDQKKIERKIGRKLDWKWEELPQIVIIVDELADLMITQGKEVEIPITRIAQKARAAGIHLILATQRPSAEVVTGLIKTNFPTRVAFKVSSSIDSRTILDSTGAEKLLGNGDMLLMTNGKSIVRYQSPYVSEKEVQKIVDEISS